MAKTLNIEPCVRCGSKDNLRTWEYEGNTYRKCMTPGCTISFKDPTEIQSSVVRNIQSNNNQEPVFFEGEYKETRGLTKETCEIFGIMMQEDRHIFKYPNAQKIRYPLTIKPFKKFGWINYSQEVGLFGEHIKYDFNREIVITEGEFDASSLYQMGIQAYSIHGGSNNGLKEITEKLDLLAKYDEIILWIDNDKAGKALLKQIININEFPTHKLKIVDSGEYKDANEVLQKCPEKLHAFVANAKEYIPEGLIFGTDIDFDELSKPEPLGIPFPFQKMQAYFHGLRESEILLIGAGSGTGKSLFCKILALNWIKTRKDLKLTFLFLEEKQKFTIKALVGLDIGIPAWKLVEDPPDDLGERAKELLYSKNYIFESHFGSLESNKLLRRLYYLAHKSDVIILDHISIIVSGQDSVQGERKDLDILMTKIKELAMKTNCRFIIVSHLNRPDGKVSYEQGLQINSNSFRSSGSLYQLSDSVIGLERNQQSSSEKHLLRLRGLKNRFIGDGGILDTPRYNSDTGRLETLDQALE